jgi:GTPase SAR1 family protein
MKKPNEMRNTQTALARAMDCDFQLNFELVGDSGVGKSSLILRFISDRYEDSFFSRLDDSPKLKNIVIDNNICRLQIWESFRERFHTTQRYKRRVDVHLICFDLTNPTSFNSVESYIKDPMMKRLF